MSGLKLSHVRTWQPSSRASDASLTGSQPWFDHITCSTQRNTHWVSHGSARTAGSLAKSRSYHC